MLFKDMKLDESAQVNEYKKKRISRTALNMTI